TRRLAWRRSVSEGAVVGAVEGGEAALDAEEVVFGAVPGRQSGVLGIVVLIFGLFGLLGLLVPEEAFDAAHPSEEPVGVDEGVDGGLFAGTDGKAGGLVLAGQLVEGFGGFAKDEEGLGVDAG